MCYTYSERLKFEVLKTKKNPLENLNEEKYKQSENEEFEAFEKVIIILLNLFFENKNFQWMSHTTV